MFSPENAINPPPRGVSAVEAGVFASVQQVGDEAVAKASGVPQNDIPATTEGYYLLSN